MTEPRRPADQTTIEDIESPDWSADRGPARSGRPADPDRGGRRRAAGGSRRRPALRWLVALARRRRRHRRQRSSSCRSPRADRRTSIALGYMPGRHRPVRRGPPRPARRPAPEARRVPREGAFPGFDDQAQLDTKLDERPRPAHPVGDGRQADVDHGHRAVVRRPARRRRSGCRTRRPSAARRPPSSGRRRPDDDLGQHARRGMSGPARPVRRDDHGSGEGRRLADVDDGRRLDRTRRRTTAPTSTRTRTRRTAPRSRSPTRSCSAGRRSTP